MTNKPDFDILKSSKRYTHTKGDKKMTNGAEKIIERIKEIDRLDKNFFNYFINNPCTSSIEIYFDDKKKMQIDINVE